MDVTVRRKANKNLESARFNCGLTQLKVLIKASITERASQSYEEEKKTTKIELALVIAQLLMKFLQNKLYHNKLAKERDELI